MINKKVILIVRDGWGYREENNIFLKKLSKKEKFFNAIELADTKYAQEYEQRYPTTYLGAAEGFVGLPSGFVGNSEVGHITMGAGEILEQSLLRINNSIDSGDFLVNKKVLGAIQNIKENDSQLHLIVLMQDVGVHSHINHLYETLKFCKKEGLKNDQVVLHLITDGRDSDTELGISFLADVAQKMEDFGVGNVGTISGRYFAMDRNKNWDRTEIYFNALYNAKSKEKFTCGMDKIFSFYQQKITDEFIPPMVKEGYEGISENDSVIFLNFRKDRAIQISQKITEVNFKNFYSMMNYSKDINAKVIFEDIVVRNTLGDILEKNKKTQLRISESEKYAHVTFFFDGGIKKSHVGKKEILINSPDVATYDLKPEMSSEGLTSEVLHNIKKKSFDFILLNFPNCDMVAHTGDIEATIKGIEAVDQSIKKIVDAGLEKYYSIILTADHGNAEEISETNRSHTKNKVPFTLISKEFFWKKDILKKGIFGLANIMPTVLDLMDIEKSDGKHDSLLKK